jgi:hypothetical protein
MSSLFLERLVRRATGKEPQVTVKPALTVDMIPQVFQPPEEGFGQYSPPSTEAPAKKGQDMMPNPSSPQQANSAPSAAAANAEGSTKQSPESNLPSDLNETNESNIGENTFQATSPKGKLTESHMDENEAIYIPKNTILQAEPANPEASLNAFGDSNVQDKALNLQPSAEQVGEAYLAKEKAKNTSASAERVTLTSNNPALSPSAKNDILPIKQENLDLADSAHTKTSFKVLIQSEQPAESFPEVNVKIKQISNISGQNVLPQNEGLLQILHSHDKAIVPEKNEINESSNLKPTLEDETSTNIQPTKSLGKGLNLESPKPYPSTPTFERRAWLQRDAETTVTVHIGRIEVHAIREAEPAVSSIRSPVLSLNDYLKQRSEEK